MPIGFRFAYIARACLVLLVLCNLFAVVAPLSVSAHTGLREADPSPNSVVDHSPTQLTLTFDEQPQPGYTRVVVYDASQRPVVTVKDPSPGASPDVLLIALPDLKTDSYAVVWQVLSQDGHLAKGVFVFTVQLPGDARPADVQPGVALDASNNPPLLSVVLAAIRYGGLLSLVGALGIVLLCLLPALALVPTEQRTQVGRDFEARAQRWIFGAFGFALGAHVLILITQVAKVNDTTLLEAVRYDAITNLLKNTTFGAVWRVQALVLLALGEWLVLLPGTARVRLPFTRTRLGITANPLPAEQAGQQTDTTTDATMLIPRWAWSVALAAGLFLLGAQIFGGHAIDVPTHPALSMLADWTHLVATSVWFGGVLLLAGLAPSLWRDVETVTRQRATVQIIARFSRLAVFAVVAFTVSGSYNALQHVSRPTLVTTGYGLALVGKVALVACIVAVAAVNRYALQPHLVAGATDARALRAHRLLTRLVQAEVLLGTAVIAVTGLLTQLPPAYKAATPARTAASAQATRPLSDVVVSIPTLSTDGVRGRLSVYAQGPDANFDALITDAAGNPRTDVQRAQLWMRSGDRDVGLVTVPLTDAGGGHYAANGPYFAVGQHWLAQLVVRRVDVADDIKLPFALEPRPVTPAGTYSATPAFPWPHFERTALSGVFLAVLGLAVLLVARSSRVRFGMRERWVYQWGSAAVIAIGVIVAAWFSLPVVR